MPEVTHSPRSLLTHATSLHGCVQLLEIVACIIGLICGFLNIQWLSQAGGGYVSFTLLVCVIFSGLFFSVHSLRDVAGHLKWQTAEWLGYVCGSVLLLPALIVSMRAPRLQYLTESDDGRLILLQTSHIIATIIFTMFVSLGYLFHAVHFTRLRIKYFLKHRKDNI